MASDHHSQSSNITWDKELKEKAKQVEQHLRSNPFYKPRPPRRGEGAESITQKLETELETMKLELNEVNDNVQQLEKQLKNLQKESENKSTCDKAKSLELKGLKKDCEDFENWKPSSKDEQILKDLRLRYRVLRNLTQVKFDFANCSEDTLSGYVFNSSTERLKPFTIDKSSLSQEEVIDKIIALKECIARKET